MSQPEYEKRPLAPQNLESAKYFAACYAGEHVAGTEFVIGALFVTWGVGMADILTGLVIGNILAVLTWALITAPVATETRLTMFAYLEKIAGSGVVKTYSAICAFLFCIGAASMITVSASAIKIFFDLPSQVKWYPEDWRFVVIVTVVGLVITAIAIGGFKRVARFAQISSPWMILMFVAGALAVIPVLLENTPETSGMYLAETVSYIGNAKIWTESDNGLSLIHVIIFAWVCNLVMHGGMADMTLFRFARKATYGYFSALGMFIGHFVAWICAGMMGAGAAMLLQSDITQLDAGDVAYQILGVCGIVAVIIAGWTTSNPTIYRAGIALQSLTPTISRKTATLIVGVATTVIACFPFVFTLLADVISLTALILSPLGGVIIAEHLLLPRLGMTRYWHYFCERSVNIAACLTWGGAVVFGLMLSALNVHTFFLPLFAWIFSIASYCILAALCGAKRKNEALTAQEHAALLSRQAAESSYSASVNCQKEKNKTVGPLVLVAYISLSICLLLAILASSGAVDAREFKLLMIFPTITYFVSAYLSLSRAKVSGSVAAEKPAAS